MKKVTAPIIHLNGSSPKSLKEAWGEAYLKLIDAKEALQKTAPHSRDFYVSKDPEVTFDAAVKEHMYRLRRIGEIQDELVALCEAVDAQTKN